MRIGDFEINGGAALAPMAGVADRAFREICIEFGAAYVVTEMVSSKGLTMHDKKSGLLTKIGFQPTAAHPRNFAITPNGQFMLVTCRDNHVIQVFKLNKKTGMMVDTKQDIKVGKPVCVQFAN